MTDKADAAAPSPLLNGPIVPTLIRLSIPNTITNLLFMLPSLIEAWRIAELGSTAIAGVALVFPLYMLLTMWSAGSVGGAVSGASARMVGAGDIAGAESVLRSGIIIALGGALVMMIMVFGLGRAMFGWIGGEGEIIEIAWTYAVILFAFNGIVWLFNMLIGVIRGSGDMIRPMQCVLVMAILHAVLSGPFILGGFGLPGWGIAGAAFLLVLAYAVGLVMAVGFLRRAEAKVRLTPGRIDWPLTLRLIKPGLLAASQSIMTITASLILTGYAARFGPDVLAGYGIGARIELVMIPLIFGVGGASIAMCGASAGAGLRNRAIRVAWIAALLASLLIGSIGLVLAFSVPYWAPVFASDPAIVEVLIHYVQQVGPVYFFLALGLALFFASQGLQTLVFPVLGSLVRLVLVLLGGFVIFGLSQPDEGHLFWLIAIAMIAYGVFIATSLRLGPWKH